LDADAAGADQGQQGDPSTQPGGSGPASHDPTEGERHEAEPLRSRDEVIDGVGDGHREGVDIVDVHRRSRGQSVGK
jgi:hypothetical protein